MNINSYNGGNRKMNGLNVNDEKLPYINSYNLDKNDFDRKISSRGSNISNIKEIIANNR